MNKNPKDYNLIDFSDGSSDIPIKPVKKTRKTLQLQQGVQFQQLQQQFLIPGITFVEEAKKENTGIGQLINIENLNVDDNTLLHTDEFLEVIKNFDYYMGLKKSNDIQLPYEFLIYEPPEMSEYSVADQILQFTQNSQPIKAIEFLLHMMKKNPHEQLLMEATAHVEVIFQSLVDSQNNNEIRFQLINGFLTLLKLHTEQSTTQNNQFIQQIKDFCHHLTLNEEIEVKNYIDTNIIICEIHLLEYTQYSKDDSNHNQQNLKLKQILVQCFYYLEQVLRIQLKEKCSLFEEKLNKILLSLPYHLFLAEHNYRVNKIFLIDESFEQFNIVIATIILILTGQYYINNNQSPLTGKQTSSKCIHEKNVIQPFNKQNYKILQDDFIYDNEYNKDFEMILQTVNTNVDKSVFSDSDTTESSSRYNHLRVNTTKLEVDPNIQIPYQAYQKLLNEQSNLSNITGVLLKNNEMILQIILQLRHYVSIDNLEKYLLDLFLIQHHKKVITLLSEQQTDNTLQNTTLKLNQDSKIIDCYIYSSYENIVHMYITFLRQGNQKYFPQYKYQNLFVQALNNSTYQLPNSKNIQQCGLYLLKQSLYFDPMQSQIDKARNYITQSQINENLGEWTQAVDNLIDVINLQLYNQIDVSLKIAQLLFSHSEYQFAQFFYCYAIKLTTKSPVICDEKAISSTNQTKNSQQCQFYTMIKNNDLEEKMKQRSQSSTCFSDSSISNQDVPKLNQQAIDIYFKRVECYLKIKEYSKATKILNMLLQDRKLHQQQKIQILFKLNSITVLFISNMILQNINNFKSLYKLLKQQFQQNQVVSGSMIPYILLYAQFYFRTDRYLESLYLIMLAIKLQDKLQHESQFSQWQYEFKQHGSQQVLLYWLQSVLGISQLDTHQFITQLSPKLRVSTQQFQFSFNFVLDYLQNEDTQLVNDNNGLFLITITDDELICSEQSIEECQQIYFQLLIYLMKNIEYDIYIDERQNVTSYLLNHVSFVINSQEILTQHFNAILSQQINFQKVVIKQTNSGVQFGFPYSPIPIITFQNLMQFKNYLLKEIYILLQYAADIEIKLDVLLSYIQFCLLEQMQVSDISQILENVVQAVYSIYLCGHHTIMSFFDFNVQSILKIKQIYQQIIIICFQLTPRPAYTQLFLDALYQIDLVIQNITQRKVYPTSLHLDITESDDQVENQLDSFLDINFKNLSTNILKYVNTGRKGPPKNASNQSDQQNQHIQKQDEVQCFASNDEVCLNQLAQQQNMQCKLKTALSCNKIIDLNTDSFGKLMGQSLSHTDYRYLSSYQDYYNQNKSDFGQESQQFQQLQYIESVMQYDQFILHLVLTNNNYSSDHCLTKSTIQLTDIVIRQYKVQEIVNAADVIRNVLSDIFNFQYNLPLYEYVNKYYLSKSKYEIYQYLQIRNYIYCIQQNNEPVYGIMLVDKPSLNNNIYKNNYSATKNKQQVTILGQQHNISPINTTMWYFDQNMFQYMSGLFQLDNEQANEPQSNMMKKAMLDQLQNLFKINPESYNICQNPEDNQIFNMNEPFLNEDKQQLLQQLPNDSSLKSQKVSNFDPKNTFLIYMQQVNKLYNSKLQNECEKLLLSQKVIISSIYLICLPFEQLFNQHINRFTSMIDLLHQEQQDSEQQGYYKNILNAIANNFKSIKDSVQNKQPTDQQKLQTNQQDAKLKNSTFKKTLQQLSQYTTQINFQYTIQQVHFSHFIEARGKTKSPSQEVRFKQVKSLALHMLLIQNNTQNEIYNQTDLMPDYIEQEDLYSNNTGILLPFHSQLLKIGMKKLTQQVKKSVGSMVQLIDVSDYICNNELQFIFKDILQPKDISYIMNGYKQYTDQSQQNISKPIKKSKSILQFDAYIDIAQYCNMYNFIRQNCQFDDKKKQLPNIKGIKSKLEGLSYSYKQIQYQLLIVTFQDILAQTDLICLASNRIKILVVPATYVIRAATFINRINQYLLENVNEHNWNSGIGSVIYGNIQILINLIAFILRREYKIPVILFQ